MHSYTVNPQRVTKVRSPMIYGQFLEQFHRQIYGGVFNPGNPLSDEEGMRRDVIEALKRIRVPVIRWPGGCFVSAYDWKKGVGKTRIPYYDKAWKVEEPNTFGTDEFISFCHKVGCEPYLCTNAGTGTPEQMSDWVEYCNLREMGEFARQRAANGFPEPHHVRYWSVGNENYGSWELGAKDSQEWPRFVLESAKLMRRVDQTIELSAASTVSDDWNYNLLKTAGEFLDWISLHEYWNDTNEHGLCSYEQAVAYTARLDQKIKKARGLLESLGLQDKIHVAFDEWNLRGWYHPHFTDGVTPEEYLEPREQNDDNSTYTMADAVFTACFLNTCHRYADVVKMANFAPAVNTRGLIFTHPNGIVKRSTYFVFELYTNYMGDQVLDLWEQEPPEIQVRSAKGELCMLPALDMVATRHSATGEVALAVVNRSAGKEYPVSISLMGMNAKTCCCRWISGESTESFNDVGHPLDVSIQMREFQLQGDTLQTTVPPHSVTVFTVVPAK